MAYRTLALCLAMLALGSAAGAAIMRFGLLQERAPNPPPSAVKPAATEPAPASSGAPEPKREPQPSAATAAPSPSGVHAVVCAAAGTPTLSRLPLDASEPLWAVHCGDEVHVVAVEGAGEDTRVERALRIVTRAPAPTLRAHAATLLAADLSRDGRPDLLVPFVYREGDDSAHGGALYALVREARGGFGRAQLLSSAAPRALAFAGDLFVVHLEDVRLAKASELLAMRAGPAPVRAWSAPIAIDARDAAALDLDLDGTEDVVVVGEKPSVEALYVGGPSGVRERTSFELANARHVVAADFDGDGHDDAILEGDTLAVLVASSEPRTLQPLELAGKLSQLSVVDVDADGKLDAVGLDGTSLVAHRRNGNAGFERRLLCELGALPIEVQAVVPLRIDTAGASTLLGIGRSRTTPTEVELFTLACRADQAPVLRAAPVTVRDAPLALRIELP